MTTTPPATPPRGPSASPSDVLLALADRCEREEPSHELDAEIGHATGILDFQQIARVHTAPRFTTSLDAAVTLVPEGHGWMARWPFDGPPTNAYVSFPDRESSDAIAASPVLALCAAALRARAAVLEQEGVAPVPPEARSAGGTTPSPKAEMQGGEMAEAMEAARRIMKRDGPAFLVKGKLGSDAVLVARALLSAPKDASRDDVLEEAAQLAFDQTADHPEYNGNWNDACQHVAIAIRALKEKPHG